MSEMRQNPSNPTPGAVYIDYMKPQLPNYHIITRNSNANQIPGDSDISREI